MKWIFQISFVSIFVLFIYQFITVMDPVFGDYLIVFGFMAPGAVFVFLGFAGYTRTVEKLFYVPVSLRKTAINMYYHFIKEFPSIYRPSVGGRKAKDPIIHIIFFFIFLSPREMFFSSTNELTFSLLRLILIVVYILVLFVAHLIDKEKRASTPA